MLRKLLLATSLIFTVALFQIQWIRSEVSSSVSDASILMGAQADYQTLAIGSYGNAALFLRLVASGSKFIVINLRIWRDSQLVLQRDLESSHPLVAIPFTTRVGDSEFFGHVRLTDAFLLQLIAVLIVIAGTLVLALEFGRWQISLKMTRMVAERKLEFAQKVAHDIRSPISAINLIASTLPTESPQAQLLRQSSERLTSIAADVLVDCKSGSSALDQRTIEEVLVQVITELGAQFPGAKIELVGKCDSPALIGLDRIVENLIRNAIEAGGITGKVDCTIGRNRKYDEIEIADDGSGFSAAMLKSIGQKGLTTKPNGNGLGIYSARAKVHEWNGQIDFSNSKSRGAVIRIRLPSRNRMKVNALPKYSS